nr:ribonuclease H-like domain-containing protein [Tanacetum cinerariifolium]
MKPSTIAHAFLTSQRAWHQRLGHLGMRDSSRMVLSQCQYDAEILERARIHQRTKQIEIDIHFVRDLVAAGQVRVLHVPSHYQYANIFTKGLPSVLFKEFRTNLSSLGYPTPRLAFSPKTQRDGARSQLSLASSRHAPSFPANIVQRTEKISSQKALGFFRDKYKWKNLDSTQARRNRGRRIEEEPELSRDDALPRPPDNPRNYKSQRSTNSSVASGSQKEQFKELMQQQKTLDRAAKCETMVKFEVSNAQKGTRS